jgi:hypothetical protein
MKLLKKLRNGRFQVNKAAVIKNLAAAAKARRDVLALGTIPVSQREIDEEAFELSRYNADNLLNSSEE